VTVNNRKKHDDVFKPVYVFYEFFPIFFARNFFLTFEYIKSIELVTLEIRVNATRLPWTRILESEIH